MTVRELISKLELLPPDMKVVTNGYEGGADDIVVSGPLQVRCDPVPYEGLYSLSSYSEGEVIWVVGVWRAGE